MTDEVLTPEQAAELLHVSVATVYRELRAGRLPGFKIGQQWRLSRDELLRLVQAGGLGKAAEGAP
jgi:excisionase family DNA binding protein